MVNIHAPKGSTIGSGDNGAFRERGDVLVLRQVLHEDR